HAPQLSARAIWRKQPRVHRKEFHACSTALADHGFQAFGAAPRADAEFPTQIDRLRVELHVKNEEIFQLSPTFSAAPARGGRGPSSTSTSFGARATRRSGCASSVTLTPRNRSVGISRPSRATCSRLPR